MHNVFACQHGSKHVNMSGHEVFVVVAIGAGKKPPTFQQPSIK